MNDTIPTSEVLNRAADRIEEIGLWKSGEGSGTCAANAISACADGDELDDLRHRTLNSFVVYLGGADDGPYNVIWRWNDRPDRTQAEVVAALRACAVIEAAREHRPAVVSA